MGNLWLGIRDRRRDHAYQRWAAAPSARQQARRRPSSRNRGVRSASARACMSDEAHCFIYVRTGELPSAPSKSDLSPSI